MTEMPFTPPPSRITGGKHSRIGIASFVISLLGGLVFCVAMLVSVGYGVSLGLNNPSAAQNPYQAMDLSSPMMMIAIILSWCGPILNFIGLGLGLVAVLQRTDKKTFGIIGLILSALVVLTFCVLSVVGIFGQLGS